MARYGNTTTKTSGAAAAAIAGLFASTSRDCRVYELGFALTTAVSADVGIARASNTPGTLSVGQVGTANDAAAGVGLAFLGSTWATTQPTAGNPFRRMTLPGSIGAGLIWTWPNGLVVPTGGTLLFWQYSAAAVGYSVYIEYDE